ncbi:methyltransferase domain-containing protein, partial [Cellulosimicrobium composti]|uniref:methyltransferase domain-containing protein n=1 Tax=Cellulosimicrobium composti TaxID=2672572 RepID=UPI003850B534
PPEPPHTGQPLGIEHDADAVATAHELVGTVGNVKVSAGDAHVLALEPESVDRAHTDRVLQHVADPSRVVPKGLPWSPTVRPLTGLILAFAVCLAALLACFELIEREPLSGWPLGVALGSLLIGVAALDIRTRPRESPTRSASANGSTGVIQRWCS